MLYRILLVDTIQKGINQYQSFILKMGQLQRWVSPLRLNCSETISHREKSEVGNETLDLGLQEIFMLFCYNLITFDSAAHLKWTNLTQKMELTHLWNKTLEFWWFCS